MPSQNTIGAEEITAANRVLHNGLLTGYQANIQRHHGGEEIQALGKEWGDAFNPALPPEQRGGAVQPFTIPVNSCTSGLFVALGAIGLQPGDEVIVTPYSMTCSATMPLAWGAVPVFADVDPLTFNLDPVDVERKITPKTKAILAVDLFGLPYDGRIDEIAKKYNLYVIEDAAQAVGATRDGKYAGMLGHIGVHSFNLGKHLTCGEGGLIVTFDGKLSHKCAGLVNHAEAINNSWEDVLKIPAVPDQGREFGFNLRMTEMSAAIVRAQLARRNDLIGTRVMNAHFFAALTAGVEGIKYPEVPDGYTHTHYVYPLLFDQEVWGVHRDKVVAAIKAELEPCACRPWEGVPIGGGYIKPIWRMPVFRERGYGKDITYIKAGDKHLSETDIDLTPNCTKLWKDDLIVCHRFFGPNATSESIKDVADAFVKVWENRDELR